MRFGQLTRASAVTDIARRRGLILVRKRGISCAVMTSVAKRVTVFDALDRA